MVSARAFYYRMPFLQSLVAPAVAARRRLILRSREREQMVASRLQSLLVGDVTIRVSEFDGDFRINPRSELFSRLVVQGQYEREMIDLAHRAVDPDADVLDVGANIGFFTVAIGRRLQRGRVLAIEPSSATADRLQGNISLNRLESRAVVFRGAASDAPGTMTLNYVEGLEEYSSLGNLDHPAIRGAKKQTEIVQVETIDNLVERYELKPRFMKVDVEGFEHAVFKGAIETLRKFRPTILSEMTPGLLASNGSSAAEVISMISEIGYEIKDALYPDLAPGQRPLGDIICLPR